MGRRVWILVLLGLAGCERILPPREPQIACAPAASAPAVDAHAALPAGDAGAAAASAPQALVTIVQQISFQLCTARSNRWIDDETYRREIDGLRRSSFAALGVKDVVSDAPPAPVSDDHPAPIQPQTLTASAGPP